MERNQDNFNNYNDFDEHTGVVRIYDNIDERTAIEFSKFINRILEGPLATQYAEGVAVKSITIELFSSGGCAHSSLAIYDMLTSERVRSKIPITTVAIGAIASGATVIFAAGQNRIVFPSALLMIHRPRHLNFNYVDADDVEEQKMYLTKIEERLLKVYNDVISKKADRTKIAKFVTGKGDYWFDADEAVALGMATRMAT